MSYTGAAGGAACRCRGGGLGGGRGAGPRATWRGRVVAATVELRDRAARPPLRYLVLGAPIVQLALFTLRIPPVAPTTITITTTPTSTSTTTTITTDLASPAADANAAAAVNS